MSLKAGFATMEITPPAGTPKIGWLKKLEVRTILDPLCARIAVFRSGDAAIGFIALDTLSIRWTTTQSIRARIEKQFQFPGRNIMVAATHNHAGPAVANLGDVRRDDRYVEWMVARIVDGFGRALAALQEAELGFGHGSEFEVAHNRRVVMRDGTCRTHGSLQDPKALFLEGPIDPEVAVLAARTPAGQPLGVLVNFACHPTHHGPEGDISAGYPGCLANELARRGWPVTVFLNGACGNLHHIDPAGGDMTQEAIGARLAADVEAILKGAAFSGDARLAGAQATVQLDYRKPTKVQVKGTVRGAQRFVDPAIYDRGMPALLERIRTRKTQPAEVQVLSINEVDFVSAPSEYFVENGLAIKEGAWPRHALVVSCANGMVGYVPHKAAFLRGGYETTFAGSSRMAPDSGGRLVQAAIGLIGHQRRTPNTEHPTPNIEG